MLKYMIPLPCYEGEGAGTGTPAATPQPEAPPPPAPSSSSPPEPPPPSGRDLDFDETADFVKSNFDILNADMEPDDFPAPDEPTLPVSEPPAPKAAPVPAATAPAQTPAAPVAATVPTPAVVPPPAAPPTAPPTGQPNLQPPAAAPAPADGPVDPTQVFARIQAEVAKNEPAFAQMLADNLYQMSPEQLEQLQTNPEKMLPALAAKVHVQVVSSLTKMFAQQMPVYLHGMLNAKSVADRDEGAFYTQHPHLQRDNPEHTKVVMQAAKVFRAMNPNAPKEVFNQWVGAIASSQLGMQARSAAPPASNGHAPPHHAAPAPPAVVTPGPVVRTAGPSFVPAGANNAPPAPVAPDPNPWSRLADLYLADEAGAFDPQ